MGGSCGTYSYGDEKWCEEGFVGEALGKESLGRRRRRWSDNIEIDLQEMVWDGLDCFVWLRIGTGFRT
jgi:hypothetical protein